MSKICCPLTGKLCVRSENSPEGAQLDFYFDLIFASKKDRTVNKKVA